jgi:PAS domain S-box-containing protein
MSPARKTFIRTALATAVLAALGGCSRSAPGVSREPLTTAEQVRRLTPEAAGRSVPVHLRGTVTLWDLPLLRLILQDATGAVQVEGAPLVGLGIQFGRTVEIAGTVAAGGVSPTVTCQTVVALGPYGPAPPPVRPQQNDLISGRFQYRYAEIEGLVRSAAVDHSGQVALVVRALGQDLGVTVRDLAFGDYRSLPGATIRARGVLDTSFDATGVPAGVKLWARSMGELTVTKPGPTPPEIPLQTVRWFLEAAAGGALERRVRLRGSIALEGGELVLRDSTGAVPVTPGRFEELAPGGPADVLGFASQERGRIVLSECTVVDSLSSATAAPLAALTTVTQVKSLPEDRARLGYPVRLRGVVTFRNPASNNTFLQDATGGIYLLVDPEAPTPVQAGDLVLVEGHSRPGNFAPVVAVTSIRIVGRQAFPQPARVEMAQLFGGVADSTWVEAQGVVHSIGQSHGLRTLGISWGGQHYDAYIFGPAKLPNGLLDSHVRIRGVCGSLFNFKRQVLGMHLLVPDASLVRVEGSGGPQTLPLRTIEQLLQFSSSPSFGERSRVRGVVTLTHSDGPTYISDATGGVMVQNHAPIALEVGDEVEVAGLPVAAPGLFNPVLRDAEIRKLGRGRPHEPLPVTATDILDEGDDAELVRIDAWLVDQASGKGSELLVLEAGDRFFEARLDQQALPTLEVGSLLRVTGIASVDTYESQQAVLPRSFSILLRSPADVAVLERAPWWTAARAFRVLGAVAALALLALAWIVVLRRRVSLQTADLRESRQMLQLVLDHIPERVFWKDRQSRYLGCNKACAGDAGAAAPEDIAGKTDYELSWKASADGYAADDREVMESGQAKIGYEEQQISADGTHRWLRTSKIPLYGPRGGVIGVLGAYEDITDRKRAEEKLQRYSAQLAATNEELKRFTYIVSHDLRAPLLSLRGFSAELRRSLEALRKPVEALLPDLAEPDRSATAEALGQSVPEALGFIESSVTRMDHLIGALLRLSRVGYREFHMEELDTGELLAETLRTLAHQIESHKVELKIGVLPRLVSDRTAVEQIFGNLLDNAVKYLDPQRPGRIEVWAEETAEGWAFSVRDNGRGIAEEDWDKVFAPFRRAGPLDVPGEGMGLAYVRALLNRLGGDIEFQSQLGAGSTFRFTLSATQE